MWRLIKESASEHLCWQVGLTMKDKIHIQCTHIYGTGLGLRLSNGRGTPWRHRCWRSVPPRPHDGGLRQTPSHYISSLRLSTENVHECRNIHIYVRHHINRKMYTNVHASNEEIIVGATNMYLSNVTAIQKCMCEPWLRSGSHGAPRLPNAWPARRHTAVTCWGVWATSPAPDRQVCRCFQAYNTVDRRRGALVF